MLPLPCMLVCSFACANRTRDRGCSKHPVFPAPSISKRAKRSCKPRALLAARMRSHTLNEVKGVNRAVYDVTSFRKLFDLGVRPFTHARIIRGLKCLL